MERGYKERKLEKEACESRKERKKRGEQGKGTRKETRKGSKKVSE